MRTTKINESGYIISGRSNAYRSYKAAFKASQAATAAPGVIAYYSPEDRRDYYIGLGDMAASDRSISKWGKGGIVRVVEVSP